jgi:hypothetical protein
MAHAAPGNKTYSDHVTKVRQECDKHTVPRGALAIRITRAAHSQKHTCTHTHIFLITNFVSLSLSLVTLHRAAGALRTLVFSILAARTFISNLLTRPAEIAHSRRLWWVRQQHHTQVEWVKTAGGWLMDERRNRTQHTRRELSTLERSKSGSGECAETTCASRISWENINLCSVGHQQDKY